MLEHIEYFLDLVGNFLRLWAEPIEHFVLALASVIGGIWVLLRLRRERKWDSALDIDIQTAFITREKQTLTFVEVKLTNRGQVELRAKARPESTGWAYEDKVENLKYSCSLQLKKLLPAYEASSWIDWFKKDQFESAGSLEINLLNEYEDPEKNKTDFWMEPGEVYRLGCPVTLAGGVYLMKVTFIGNKSGEFWSRITLIQVPSDGGDLKAAISGPISGPFISNRFISNPGHR